MLFSGQTLPSMSVLNPGWPHRGESLIAQDAGPPANLDSGPGHLPEEDPEETSAQVVGVLPFLLRPICLHLLDLLPFPPAGERQPFCPASCGPFLSAGAVSTAPSGHESLTKCIHVNTHYVSKGICIVKRDLRGFGPE